MVQALGSALIALGIVLLFVIGSRRMAHRPSPLKLAPLTLEEEAQRSLRREREHQARKEERARWFRAIGVLGRLLTYGGLFLLLYIWSPKDISHTPLASLTLSDIASTFAFIAFGIVLIRALFNPSQDRETREAWSLLGIVILGAIGLAAIYFGTR